MEDRQARVRLEDTVTKTKNIKCGSPQGSPLSPILFILYIADIFLQDTEHRFGYADDICVLRTGRSLEEIVEKLGEDLSQILGWGAEHKVKFNPEKCELKHFTRSRDNTHSPEVAAPEFDFTIPEQPGTAVRWLEVWFDRKLIFSHHVKKRTNRLASSSTISEIWRTRDQGHPQQASKRQLRHVYCQS